MKIISLGAPTLMLEDLLRLAQDGNVILRTADGREYVLAEIADFDRELAITRENEELMKLLDERSKDKNLNSIPDARRKLGV